MEVQVCNHSNARDFGKFIALFTLLLLLLLSSGCSGGSGSSDTTAVAESSKSLGPKISNGISLSKDDIPPLNQMLIDDGTGQFKTCSGTFLNAYQLLTAAHCVWGAAANGVYVALDSNLTNVIRSSQISIHPDYIGEIWVASDLVAGLGVLLGDIAVVTVEEPYDGPVVALASRTPYYGEQMLIAGYGAVSNAGNGIDGTLRAGQTTVDGASLLQGTIVTAFDSLSESSICPGDSGGAAFVTDGTYWMLIGVHSATAGGCEVGSMAVESMVSAPQYLGWILSVTGGNVIIQ